MATVVVPFVHGHLNQATVRAVQYSGFWCRFVDLDPMDPGAYGRLVRQLWRSQTTVIICEQDVVPTRDQLATLQSCGHEWCSYSYDGDLYPGGPMFGLVRFAGLLMARLPQSAQVALTNPDWRRGLGRKCDDARNAAIRQLPWTENGERKWWSVDSAMARDLTIRGVEWVEHHPVVHHAHAGPPSGPS